ncbi:MAG: ADYC domain-containing protein [Myxococcaceae bacterium]
MFKTQLVSAGVVVLLAGAQAEAGGTRTQGTYVCGQGLDILQPLNLSAGAPKVPKGDCYTVVSGTLPNGPLTLNDPNHTTITVPPTSCQPKGNYWDCPSATFSSPYFCDANPSSPSVHLYVLKATVVAGDFTFGGSALTPVCRSNEDAVVQISCGVPRDEPYSTAGDCIYWRFDPTTQGTKRFQACVRMARDDYLGTGVSATRFGTWIQPYNRWGTSPLNDPTCSDKGSGLEALWNEKGAFCIYHYRWPNIAQRLLTIAGLPPGVVQQAGEKFKHPVRGLDVVCVDVIKDEEELARLELLRNRSEVFECSYGGLLLVTPVGLCQYGYDPDCVGKVTCPY